MGSSGKFYHGAPRWSTECTDCSVPLALDTYSKCSFGCAYCFAVFQKRNKREYSTTDGGSRSATPYDTLRWVDPARIRRLFTLETESEFSEFIRQRNTLQWGSMSDPFCYFEKKNGISLELMRFFKEIEYPITFSTKGVFYVDDERYRSLIEGTRYWHWKISIITSSDTTASRVEQGCPSTTERFRAISELAKMGVGGVTMRLRPIIPGITTVQLEELVKRAADAGADSISTEFYCLEMRAVKKSADLFDKLSKAVGFDMVEFYKRHSKGAGYKRLNKNFKREYFDRLRVACDKHKIRLYISDADFKEWSCNASCCGLPGDGSFKYWKGSFLYALIVARNRGAGGLVTWDDLAPNIANTYDKAIMQSTTINTGTPQRRAKYYRFTLREWLHHLWNHPNEPNSPYRIFGGVLEPDHVDKSGNIVYRYEPRDGKDPELRRDTSYDGK